MTSYEGGGPADPAIRPAQINGAGTFAPRAPASFTFQGKRYRRRRGFVPTFGLTCPLGHHISRRVIERAIIIADGALSCMHRERRAEKPCGAQLYVMGLIARDRRSHFWVADVETADIITMKNWRMAAHDVLAYLGASLPEVALLSQE